MSQNERFYDYGNVVLLSAETKLLEIVRYCKTSCIIYADLESLIEKIGGVKVILNNQL